MQCSKIGKLRPDNLPLSGTAQAARGRYPATRDRAIMRRVQLACRFVSPPTRAWWVMAAPFGSLRNGDDHKNLGL